MYVALYTKNATMRPNQRCPQRPLPRAGPPVMSSANARQRIRFFWRLARGVRYFIAFKNAFHYERIVTPTFDKTSVAGAAVFVTSHKGLCLVPFGRATPPRSDGRPFPFAIVWEIWAGVVRTARGGLIMTKEWYGISFSLKQNYGSPYSSSSANRRPVLRNLSRLLISTVPQTPYGKF